MNRRLVVDVGFGNRVDAGRPFDLRLGSGQAWLRTGVFRGFAVASVEEDAGSGEAVVLGGVVFALCDFVQEVEDVARVVGPRADLFGESLRWGW